MKAVFVILVLLIAAEWMKREACKSGRHPWKRLKDDERHKKTKEMCNANGNKRRPRAIHGHHITHLLVIGAGAQTVALLAALYEYENTVPMECYRIIIVETKSKFGVGSQFDGDEVNPEHLMTVYVSSAISMSSDGNDFANWVSQHPDLFGLHGDRVEPFQLPLRREVVGKYLEWKFEQLVQEFSDKFDIVLIDNTSADNVTIADSSFEVTLSDGRKIHTIDIFLATGLWDLRLFDKHIDGFFQSPWPASDLIRPVTGIPENAQVGIRGDGQNAIDAALTLAHKHGNFSDKVPTPEEPHPHGFDYTPNSKDFLMTIYSRSGHLPSVGGVDNKYLLDMMEQLDVGTANGHPSLDDVVNAMRADLVKENEEIDQIDFRDAKQFMQDLEAFMYQNEPPKQRLETAIKEARESWQHGETLLYQSFFASTQEYFSRFMQQFSAKDTVAYRNSVAPRVHDFGSPMLMHNAEKLLAMMTAGCLKIVAVGVNSEVVKGRSSVGGVGIKFKNLNFPHRYFIDATEQSGDVKRNPSPLVQSLIRNELIQPILLPLPDNVRVTGADAERVERVASNNGGKRGEQRFYRSDGIRMDMDTMRVIPHKELPGVIYASGPFTFGQYAFSKSLPNVLFFGQLVAGDIGAHRFEKYSTVQLERK